MTGTTAVGVDVSRKMTAALPEYLVLVLGVSFVLLLLAFRSVVLPLQAAAGFLLTTGATLGLTAGVSGGGTLTSFLPTVLVGVLFGLAMSFDVSLVTRIRAELARGRDATGATIAGVGRQARVLAVAGLVLAAVFGAFVLAGDPTVRAIGFGLAVGVLVDVFLVRLILVPATLAMLGDRAWRAPAGLRRRRGRHVARRRTALVRA